MKNADLVSIVIPCLNEEKYIGECLESIISNDYPKDKLEVLVVDGMSEDRTQEIVKHFSDKQSFIKLLENPSRIVPTALNIGIKKSNGAVVMRMDAHTRYGKEYISKCVKHLNENHADNVGGVCLTLPGDNTSIANSIALSLAHPFGVGNSYFRIGLKEARQVDAVPFGCFRRDVFEKIGFFNENMVRNQDIEFSIRLKKAGGKIWLVPDIISYYSARPTLKALAKNNFWNGFWVIYSTKYAKLPFSVRHLIPLIFILSLLLSLLLSVFFESIILLFAFISGLYMLTNIFFSFKLSLGNGMKYFLGLIATFTTLHFSYGLGSLSGLARLCLLKLKSTWKNERSSRRI